MQLQRGDRCVRWGKENLAVRTLWHVKWRWTEFTWAYVKTSVIRGSAWATHLLDGCKTEFYLHSLTLQRCHLGGHCLLASCPVSARACAWSQLKAKQEREDPVSPSFLQALSAGLLSLQTWIDRLLIQCRLLHLNHQMYFVWLYRL